VDFEYQPFYEFRHPYKNNVFLSLITPLIHNLYLFLFVVYFVNSDSKNRRNKQTTKIEIHEFKFFQSTCK
jgi:hypothetical protein